MAVKRRIEVPADLAARILFQSDRSCCVCRIAGRKVQVHHIDSDPSNNDPENLAVLCGDCHSEAHTNVAFARNLGSDLIQLYSQSWKAAVAARLEPGNAVAEQTEYELEVLLRLSLVPHSWKNEYMALYPGHFLNMNKSATKVHTNVWDAFSDRAKHRYTAEEWKRYLRLFDISIPAVVRRLEEIVATYGDAVPAQIRLAILRSGGQILVERSVYLRLPDIADDVEDTDHFFRMRFTAVLRVLRDLTDEIDSHREKGKGET